MTLKEFLTYKGYGCFFKEMTAQKWDKMLSRVNEISGHEYKQTDDIPLSVLEKLDL